MDVLAGIGLAFAACVAVVLVTNLVARLVRRFNLAPWIAGAVGGFVVASVATPLILYLYLFQGQPDVPLTAALGGGRQNIDAAFDHRVQATFPVGSDESALAAELSRQEFVRRDFSSSTDAEHEAVWHKGTPYSGYFRIFWRVDAGGRITAVRGRYCRFNCLGPGAVEDAN